MKQVYIQEGSAAVFEERMHRYLAAGAKVLFIGTTPESEEYRNNGQFVTHVERHHIYWAVIEGLCAVSGVGQGSKIC